MLPPQIPITSHSLALEPPSKLSQHLIIPLTPKPSSKRPQPQIPACPTRSGGRVLPSRGACPPAHGGSSLSTLHFPACPARGFRRRVPAAAAAAAAGEIGRGPGRAGTAGEPRARRAPARRTAAWPCPALPGGSAAGRGRSRRRSGAPRGWPRKGRGSAGTAPGASGERLQGLGSRVKRSRLLALKARSGVRCCPPKGDSGTLSGLGWHSGKTRAWSLLPSRALP